MRRRSVTFDENLKQGLVEYDNEFNQNSMLAEERFLEKSVQTDSEWLELLKKELSSSLLLDQKERQSIRHRSKPGTIKSFATKKSTQKSRKIGGDVTLEENAEHESVESSEVDASIPPYPEMIVNDEYGITYLSSSEDEEEIDIAKITEEIQNPPLQFEGEITSAVPIENIKSTNNNTIPDAGLPAILKPSKELSIPEQKPKLSPDEIIQQALTSNTVNKCEFCQNPITEIPSLDKQITDKIDQAEVFCCEKYRELIEHAVQECQKQGVKELQNNASKKLIDVSPGKSFKSEAEQAEAKVKSEKKIRERILARQQAALVAAQTARQRIEGSRRAHSEIISTLVSLVDEENTDNRGTDSALSRQMKVINYQLSSCKFLEDGWTVRPPSVTDDEFMIREEIRGFAFDTDSINPAQEILNQLRPGDSNGDGGIIVQYYPNGQQFLIIYSDGTGNIYYPSGNVACTFLRDSNDGSKISVLREDSCSGEINGRLMGIVSSKGVGSFYYSNGFTRITFDKLMGLELTESGDKKRQWFWDGRPHVHAPPFQPIFLSVNKYVGLRISSQQAIYLNFLAGNKHIYINVGCQSQAPKSMQKKMTAMAQMDTEKLMMPLMELRNKAQHIIQQFHLTADYPHLNNRSKTILKPIVNAKNDVTINSNTIRAGLM